MKNKETRSGRETPVAVRRSPCGLRVVWRTVSLMKGMAGVWKKAAGSTIAAPKFKSSRSSLKSSWHKIRWRSMAGGKTRGASVALPRFLTRSAPLGNPRGPAVHAEPVVCPCATRPGPFIDFLPITRPALELKRFSYIELTDLCTRLAEQYGLSYTEVNVDWIFHFVPRHLAKTARINEEKRRLEFRWEPPPERPARFCQAVYGRSRSSGMRLVLLQPLALAQRIVE